MRRRSSITSTVGSQCYDYDGLSRQTALNGGYERYLYDGSGERIARVTAPSFGTKLYTISPCRVLDTRFTPPAVTTVPRVVQLSGSCGIPLEASGVVGNLAAIPLGSGGLLRLYPTGTTPATSTLNFNVGQVRANNNPLRFTDPTGLITTTVVGCPTLQICVDETVTVTVTASAPRAEEWNLQGSVIQDLCQRQPGSGKLALQSAAAFADGVVPFGNPFQRFGAYDPSRLGLSTSREIGEATRDLEVTLLTMEEGSAIALGMRPLPRNWFTDTVFRWSGTSSPTAKVKGPHFHLPPSIKRHLPYELRQWYFHTRAILHDALKRVP